MNSPAKKFTQKQQTLTNFATHPSLVRKHREYDEKLLEAWKREFYINTAGEIPSSCRKIIDDHNAEIRRLRKENYLLKHELKLLKRIIANLPDELAQSFIEKRY